MHKDIQAMIGDIDFNYDDDTKEFGKMFDNRKDRIVNIIGAIDEQGTPILTLSFNLGRKPDDTISLTLKADEFLNRFFEAIIFGENYEK